VHKKTVSACIRIRHSNRTETKTAVFPTFTQDLEELRHWLQEHKVTHVAMESTGVYWIPVWNILERSEEPFELTLVNAQHVHALPGRKTDRQDAKRIAELLQYGMLSGSFIPPRPVRELRDLTRRRTHLQHDRNRIINRISRLLETVNIKLKSVISDITGKTGTLMLQEMAHGGFNPDQLVQLAKGSLKRKKPELAASLKGFYSEHFRWLLSQAMHELSALDRKLLDLDKRIAQRFQPHADLVLRLCTIPGIDFTTATTILAEIGFDMSRFPDEGHLASWAGFCPGNNESAGKRFSGRTRKGNRYLRRVLVQCAWSLIHKKDCFLTALFYRVAARGGMKKAAIAVGHRMLTIAWRIIGQGVVYRELGGSYYDRLRPEHTARRLARRLEQIGFQVTLKPKEPRAEETARPAVPRPMAADPAVCRRCAKWGIPCIHVRNATRAAPITPSKNQRLPT
jgi:transposase